MPDIRIRKFTPAARETGTTTVRTGIAYYLWVSHPGLYVVRDDGQVMPSDYMLSELPHGENVRERSVLPNGALGACFKGVRRTT